MPVPFTKNDLENLELVRSIVLHRLQKDKNYRQLSLQWIPQEVGDYVRFEPLSVRDRFLDLENEVLWQLIIQGVIIPGDLPWFRITDHGRKVLEAERPIPHDPAGYLDDIRDAASEVVGDTTLAYLEEALRCYTSGCNIASVLLLGVAAESVFLKLWDIVGKSLTTEKDRREFRKLDRSYAIAPKHRWLTDKVVGLPPEARKQLPENLQMTISSLYQLIRQQRNDLGHPREEPPSVDREQAFVFFRLFPTFIRDVESFAAYCSGNQI